VSEEGSGEKGHPGAFDMRLAGRQRKANVLDVLRKNFAAKKKKKGREGDPGAAS